MRNKTESCNSFEFFVHLQKIVSRTYSTRKITKMKLHTWAHHVTRGSSPVDWCEDNYTFSPFIGKYQISTYSLLAKDYSFTNIMFNSE